MKANWDRHGLRSLIFLKDFFIKITLSPSFSIFSSRRYSISLKLVVRERMKRLHLRFNLRTWDFLIRHSAANNRLRLPVQISLKNLHLFNISFTAYTLKTGRSVPCHG